MKQNIQKVLLKCEAHEIQTRFETDTTAAIRFHVASHSSSNRTPTLILILPVLDLCIIKKLFAAAIESGARFFGVVMEKLLKAKSLKIIVIFLLSVSDAASTRLDVSLQT